jgi:hypothetical protein
MLLVACGSTVPSSPPTGSAAHGMHGTEPPGASIVPDEHTDSMTLLATLPKEQHSADFYHSDLAFWGDLAVQGSYDGFRIIDISEPAAPRLVADVECRGPQGDVSIWQNLVVVSVDRPQSEPGCDSEDAQDVDPHRLPKGGAWEGIRIFDVTRPADPQLVAAVRTDCGSHTHTLVPDEEHGRAVIYVSSFAILQDRRVAPGCLNPHGHISVVSVPLDAPQSAAVIARPELVDTPIWEVFPGAPPTFHATTGCHDISVYLRLHLAAAACLSEGQIWDITDPVHPRTIAHVDVPEITFWHSAAWSNDGTVVAFGDESLAPFGCSDPPAGGIWFYRVADPAHPELAGRFNLGRQQGSVICSAHMFNVIPGVRRSLLVSAFYAGGTSVIDFTDPAHPTEVAYYDVNGTAPGNQWSANWYRGQVYASDHLRGLDVFSLDLPELVEATELPHLDPQTQE